MRFRIPRLSSKHRRSIFSVCLWDQGELPVPAGGEDPAVGEAVEPLGAHLPRRLERPARPNQGELNKIPILQALCEFMCKGRKSVL